MPYKDPESKRAWRRRAWARRDPEAYRAYQREWYAKQPKPEPKPRRLRAGKRDLTPEEREQRRAKQRRERAALRLAAIARLGGRCRTCGIDDPAVLEFDHIEPLCLHLPGASRSHRRSCTTYREVVRRRNPRAVFDLLCCNCHERKTRANGDRVAYLQPAPVRASPQLELGIC